MPWTIRQSYRNCNGYAVVKESDGSIAGCHVSRVSAVRQIAALEASEAEKQVITNQTVPNKYPQGIRSKRKKMKKAAELYDMLNEEEKAYHDALVEIVEDFGYFDEGTSGVWVGYESADENENSGIGVKCMNCSFHYDNDEGQIACQLLSFLVEENAKCRLAAIPDGLVNTEMEDDEMENVEDDMMERIDKADSVSVGQMVSWSSSGGRATGKVVRVIRNGKYNVPSSDFTITGTPDDPAVAIRIYRDGKPTDTIVGHKMKTLRSVSKSMDEDDSFGKKDYSSEQRRNMARRGQAMSDGSFPIANRADLANAIQSVGRAENYDAAKRHIISRARALGALDMLPEDWNVNKGLKNIFEKSQIPVNSTHSNTMGNKTISFDIFKRS